MIKGLIATIGTILFIFVIVFVIEGLGLVTLGVFGPWREEIRRETFEETKSFNESKKQDLIRYRLQYLQAEANEKEAIASTIRMMFADYDESKLEPELAEFLRDIKY